MPPPAEAPYKVVPAGWRARSIAWPQLAFLLAVMAAAMLPLVVAYVLAA